MKKLTLSIALAGLALTGFATTSSAQFYERHTGGPRLVVETGRGSRTIIELDRLNREVRRTREDIREYGAGRRIRSEFYQIMRATDQLNAYYRRGIGRGWEIRRRAEELRIRLDRIQRELSFRGDRPRGPRGPRGWR